MVNVNGVMVELVNAAPRRVAKGWLHESSLYCVDGGTRQHIGIVSSIWTAKHGGKVRERWARVGTWAEGQTLMDGNVNDCVTAWMRSAS